jgi:hypothetical protein
MKMCACRRKGGGNRRALQRAEPAWCLTPVEAPSPDAAAPCRGGTGTRRWHLSGALGGAAGRTRWPWRVVHATGQPSGQWTVGCTSPVTRRVGCPRRTRHWRRENDAHRGTRLLALLRDFSPKSVAPDSTHDFPPVYFLPHTVPHLCYDGVAYEHGAQAPGKEDTGSLSGSSREDASSV